MPAAAGLPFTDLPQDRFTGADKRQLRAPRRWSHNVGVNIGVNIGVRAVAVMPPPDLSLLASPTGKEWVPYHW